MKRLPKTIAIYALCVFAVGVHATTVIVPGTSNPWLAGMPDDSLAGCGADSATNESPVLVTGPSFTGGSVLIFNAVGGVNYYSGFDYFDPPDGDSGFVIGRDCSPENGIPNIVAPIDSLLGVFLDDTQPDLSPAPAPFPYLPDDTTITPGLKQVFFIGDGLTSDEAPQDFVVPADATRLFLGTMDTYGWYNNGGAFTVTVSSVFVRIDAIAREGNDLRLTWTSSSDITNFVQATAGTANGSYSNNFADISAYIHWRQRLRRDELSGRGRGHQHALSPLPGPRSVRAMTWYRQPCAWSYCCYRVWNLDHRIGTLR